MFVLWKVVGDALALGLVVTTLIVTRGVFRH
jgi:hypothetical protein